MDSRMGKQRRCLFETMELGKTGFSAGAEVHAWRLSRNRRTREDGGGWGERKHIGNLLRNGCTGAVHAR